MFNVLSLLTLAFAATSALAVPTSKLTSSACDGLGRGAFDNVATFTLAAWNSTLPNANSTGVPLVFGSAGAISGASFHVISVRILLFLSTLCATHAYSPRLPPTSTRPCRALRPYIHPFTYTSTPHAYIDPRLLPLRRLPDHRPAIRPSDSLGPAPSLDGRTERRRGRPPHLRLE